MCALSRARFWSPPHPACGHPRPRARSEGEGGGAGGGSCGREFFQRLDMNWNHEPGSAGILPNATQIWSRKLGISGRS